MSERKINLEEILSEKLQPMVSREPASYVSVEQMRGTPEWGVTIEAMKEACRQVLELAAENAEGWNIDSITNTINQIE